MNILPRSFYLRSTLKVAPDLLGKFLVYHSPKGTLTGEINEVEAYRGEDDPACHAFGGKTGRTEILFEEGGFSYIYFIYGMYYCLNVSTEVKDQAGAVLIRSIIPVEGIEIMAQNRYSSAPLSPQKRKNLTNGPGKLCQAFGLTTAENGVDMTNSPLLYIEDRGKKVPHFETTPRIGIRKATDFPWRFYYNPPING